MQPFAPIAFVVLVTLALPNNSAVAASLTTLSGDVFVNAGSGFRPAATPLDVGPGTQVLVRNGGTALIGYGVDCIVKIDATRVWSVASGAPCAAGTRFVDLTLLTGHAGAAHGGWQTSVSETSAQSSSVGNPPQSSGNSADAGADGTTDATQTTAQTAEAGADGAASNAAAGSAGSGAGLSSTVLVVGGVVAAGGIGLAIASSGGSSSTPASP